MFRTQQPRCGLRLAVCANRRRRTPALSSHAAPQRPAETRRSPCSPSSTSAERKMRRSGTAPPLSLCSVRPSAARTGTAIAAGCACTPLLCLPCAPAATPCDIGARAAGEMLTAAEPHLERNVHPTVICRAYLKALDDAVAIINEKCFEIDFGNDEELMRVVESCISTKLTRRYGQLIPVRAPASCVLKLCAQATAVRDSTCTFSTIVQSAGARTGARDQRGAAGGAQRGRRQARGGDQEVRQGGKGARGRD